MGFDQRIDPAAVLRTIQVYAGNEKVELVLATQEEIDTLHANQVDSVVGMAVYTGTLKIDG